MDEYISKQAAVDAGYLSDWYIASVGDESPVWTDAHIDELLNDFIVIPKDTPSADVQPIQWISCKDNMPDTLERGLSTMYSDCCLVCDAFGWVGMAYYITDGQKSWWEFADAQNKNKIDWTEVTHWMPLPEPPKDGDTE